ncbi:MAG TPA: histidine kinase dimerization/phospho-acceptor domain-containing protein [Aggregatilinea sp.]|uniref:histidine kinase dimerization/phospho-acceptor domain-containing protein n=1 Tax=Aggregatilinea sp. TaxID=2806333 RepID=UPI002C8FCFDD|nr:histidine kinase dimerization/phospho-acceptor domain-containing protein [Aggregatilinea sp.]HML20078.1 histidine kinase dimerization/phospho-acceptor domain-containing protein [Aggregatilinea sp.]
MSKQDSLDTLALHAWADTSSDGVIVVDLAGRIDLINVSAQEFLLTNCVPETVDELLACVGAPIPSLSPMFSRDLVSETTRWGSMRVPKYPARLLTWHRVPLYSLGDVVGVLLVIKAPPNTSPIDRVNQSFLSVISHDLRTPLSAILGFAELLRNNRGTLTADEQTEFLDHIIKNANELNQYTQIALDIMYLEANLQQFEIEPMVLSQFVGHWMSDARHRFPGGRLVYQDGVAEEPITRFSPSALHRILHILVEFAMAESVPPDPVQICLSYSDSMARVLIQHSAPNLPASDAPSLFEILTNRDLRYQGRPYLHRMQLYVASLLAERQNGSLTLHAQGGDRYLIELMLPCAAPA